MPLPRKLVRVQRGLNRLLLGNVRVSAKQAKKIVQKEAGGKIDVKVNSSVLPAYRPGFGDIVPPSVQTTRNPSVAAHEGRHAWQDKKNLFRRADRAGTVVGATSGLVGLKAGVWDDPFDHSKNKTRSTTLRAAGKLPELLSEADANLRAVRYPGGKRFATTSMGSYIGGAGVSALNTHMTIGALRAIRRKLPWNKRAQAAKLAAAADKKYSLQYANKPITKPGVKLLGSRNGNLPETWVQDYEDTLRALSKLNLNKPGDAARAKELEVFLDKLEQQSKRAGRGKVFRPSPGGMNIYPDMAELPHEAIKRSVRANTGADVRALAWDQVKSAAKPFKPGVGLSRLDKRRTGMDTLQQRNFMEAAAVGLPIGQGREPHFLGQKVPGEISLGPVGTRSIQGKGAFSSSDWARGFSPMKFTTNQPATHYRKLPKIGGLRKPRRHWGKTTIGAALVGAAITPAISEPGYLLGVGHGSKQRALAPEQTAVRRFIPGYMEGYFHGKVLATPKQKKQKFSLPTNSTKRYAKDKKPQDPNWLIGTGAVAGTAGMLGGGLEMAGGYIDSAKRAILSKDGDLDVAGPKLKADWVSRLKSSVAHARKAKGKSAPVKWYNPTKGMSHKNITNRRMTIGVGTYLTGLGVAKIAEASMKSKKDDYSFTPAERYYYEAGFMSSLKDRWETFKTTMKRDLLPTMTRGAFVGGLGKLHQETGMLPPTTVDGIPVIRRSADSSFAPFNTSQLENTLRRAKARAAAASTTAEEEIIEDAIKSLETEILMRRNLPSV